VIEPNARRRRTVLLVAIASAIGAAGAFVPRLLTNDPIGASVYDERSSIDSLHLPGDASGTPDRAARPHPVVPAAASPKAAVESFLRAEVAADHARSFGFLASADREAFSTPQRWERQHGTMPTLVGFRIGVTSGDNVDATLRFAPGLDEIVGLVPASASATLVTVAEDGGYRVAFTQTITTANHADVAGVLPAVRTWVHARSECDSTTAARFEWTGGVLGDGAPTLLEELCHTAREPSVGVEARPLVDRFGIEPLVAAFGPEVGVWARVVELRVSNLEFDLVLAPVGEQWLVIGAIAGTPAGSG
jgi:hypothetical protein